jgi:hypothetical protein
MAGMSDNPLVGDYTKGISKGRQYFVELRTRFFLEKADLKHVTLDLQMGLFKEAKAFTDAFVKLNHLDRFGPVPVPKTGPKSVALRSTPLAQKQRVIHRPTSTIAKNASLKVSALQDIRLLYMQLCG